jgi:uncharacterized lipoprotein YajG
MRKQTLFVLSLVVIFVSGCSFKDGAVEFAEPRSIYMGDKAYAKAYLAGASDDRADKKSVGVIKDRDGAKQSIALANQNMSEWLDKAFEKEMRAAGFAPVSREGDSDFSYSFSLTKLNAEYAKHELTGKNLRLEMDMTVTVKNQNGVITKKYRYDEQKWVKPLFDSEAIKKELEPFMSQSVAATVKSLVELSKTR